MSNLKEWIRPLGKEKGQTTAEYYLLIAVFIIAAVAAASVIFDPLTSAFYDTATYYNTFISSGPWH